MSRWFRLYSEAMRNPKVARLSDKDFRTWVQLLAIAAENEGTIPPLDDLKHLLNTRLDHLSSALDRLINGGLIDVLEVGYCPHNWKERQYKSDSSTERVKKHRSKGNVSETPPEAEADTDTDREKEAASAAKKNAAAADPGDLKSQAQALLHDEPCLVSTDWYVIENLVADGTVTEADVLAGIRVGKAKAQPLFRFRCWRNFHGWIINCAKDRMSEGYRPGHDPPAETALESARRVDREAKERLDGQRAQQIH